MEEGERSDGPEEETIDLPDPEVATPFPHFVAYLSRQIPDCFGSRYFPSFLPEQVCDEIEKGICSDRFLLFWFRTGHLKRAPKQEFYVPFEDGTVPIYRWGQHIKCYLWGQPMPPCFVVLIAMIEELSGERPNHCILIRYDGKPHHAPPHHDKQKGVPRSGGSGARDIDEGTTIFSFSFGVPRTFEFLSGDDIVWSKKLGRGSLLCLSPLANQKLKHAVPKEDVGGVRFSAIFRTIKRPDADVLGKAEAGKVCFCSVFDLSTQPLHRSSPLMTMSMFPRQLLWLKMIWTSLLPSW